MIVDRNTHPWIRPDLPPEELRATSKNLVCCFIEPERSGYTTNPLRHRLRTARRLGKISAPTQMGPFGTRQSTGFGTRSEDVC